MQEKSIKDLKSSVLHSEHSVIAGPVQFLQYILQSNYSYDKFYGSIF